MKWLFLFIGIFSLVFWLLIIAAAYREGYVEGGIAAAKAQALRTEGKLKK